MTKQNNCILYFYTTSNLIQEPFKTKETNGHENNFGVHKISYSDCAMFYIGQTAGKFKDRFWTHVHIGDVVSYNSNSALQLIDNHHRYTSCADNIAFYIILTGVAL